MSVPVDSPWAFVAVGRPVRGEFTYQVPEALRGKLSPGQRVRIPFGRQSTLGFFLAPAGPPSAEVVKRLKSIERPLEESAALTPELVELLRFAASHYRYPLGEAMRGAMPPGLSQNDDGKEAKADLVWWAAAVPEANLASLARAPSQHAALSYLLAVGGRALVEELVHAIPGAKATLKVLAQKGLVTLDSQEVVHGVRAGLEQGRPAQLTPEQHTAVAGLTTALDAGGFSTFLLHGVTGSGKTEVYLRLVERALEQGKGSLILVPEIALTPQLVGRFKSRFGPQIAVLHSALKDRERLRHWQLLRKGTVKIAVGVRSAIWAPVGNLGVVVVDEEHDPSFKQDEKLKYQARDLAVVRAQKAGALVVLGSATPSLETLENVRRGRYRTLTLERRVDDRPMPTIALVDLRVARPRLQDEEPPVLSAALKEAIGQTLGRGQQVILFLNRRGHSTFVLCEVCGESLKCQDCDVCLTHHLSARRLVCHYCNRQQFLPDNCPKCSGPLLQLGVGTERVEAEVAASFPGARVGRLDRDAASNNERLTELLASFARREIDVLVGTQMVAKGHDFPGVTLVCVVLADSSLALPDFRAAERTFHLLTQVAGRAGRGKDPGRVLVQSYHPESEAVARMLHSDFAGFAQNELRRRKALGWPPYTRMAMVRIEGDDASVTAATARRLGQAMAQRLPPSSAGVRLLGPAPAPLARIKGKTRWQIVLKGPTHAALAGPLDAAEALLPELPASVKVVLDVDPGAML
ncbi:MAG: Helicase PriA [Myxococcaceae bacterium]|nr:Helicase PriA [Myxococcaceae bacterium]